MIALQEAPSAQPTRVVHVVVHRPRKPLRSRDRLAAVDPALARLAVRISDEIRQGATCEQLAAQF